MQYNNQQGTMRSLQQSRKSITYSRASVPTLSTDWLFRILLHHWARRVCAVGLGVLTWAKLSARGWPWWAATPAVILAAMAGYLLVILLAYAYQKSTYQIRARLVREQLRPSPEDTTPIQITSDD